MIGPIKRNKFSYLKENVEKYNTLFTSKAVGKEAFKNKNVYFLLIFRGNIFPFSDNTKMSKKIIF